MRKQFERVGKEIPIWFKFSCWLFALFFVGYSAFSLDPDINWLARLIGFGLILFLLPRSLGAKIGNDDLPND